MRELKHCSVYARVFQILNLVKLKEIIFQYTIQYLTPNKSFIIMYVKEFWRRIGREGGILKGTMGGGDKAIYYTYHRAICAI